MPCVIYQAGPLFSEAERAWHRTLSKALRSAGHAVIWPGDLLTTEAIDTAGPSGPKEIFLACKEALEGCNCLVALLDGAQVDDGTAWEIGYAYARGLLIYGIRTDSRIAGETRYNHVNSMIEGCLRGLAVNIENLIRMLPHE